MKIVIAGASGFIGNHLVTHFQKDGHHVIALSRKEGFYWDPQKKIIDRTILDASDVVINLCGETLFGRWTKEKMEAIRESRLLPTQFLCETLSNLSVPPKIYLGASAIGFYGDRPHEILDESSPSGKGFLPDLCREWEEIAAPLSQKGVRVLHTRFGVVIGDKGALQMMKKPFQIGMGGILGSGEQMMSWIAIDDVCGAFSHLIHHAELKGPVNLVSPQSVSNRVFTETLGKILLQPSFFKIPSFILKGLVGKGEEMLLSSQDVKPRVLLDSRYPFQIPNLEEALKKYI